MAAVALWLPAVAFPESMSCGGTPRLPAAPATPPANWPAKLVSIERAKGQATLLMFVHPQCPCSSASQGELAIILAHAQGKLDADLFFYLPAGKPPEWAKTDLWQNAGAIPGVRVFLDREAAMAQSFGVFTSGQTLLYDPRGRAFCSRAGSRAFAVIPGITLAAARSSALLQGESSSPSILPVVTPGSWL